MGSTSAAGLRVLRTFFDINLHVDKSRLLYWKTYVDYAMFINDLRSRRYDLHVTRNVKIKDRFLEYAAAGALLGSFRTTNLGQKQ